MTSLSTGEETGTQRLNNLLSRQMAEPAELRLSAHSPLGPAVSTAALLPVLVAWPPPSLQLGALFSKQTAAWKSFIKTNKFKGSIFILKGRKITLGS